MTNTYISGSGCFKQGTLISTPTGLVDIVDIKVGSEVLCFDDLGRLHTSKVVSVNSHSNMKINKYRLWGGNVLFVTPNHWVLNNENTFCEVKDINESLSLVDIRGFLVPIIESTFDSIDTVYNFIVEKYHTYIADGIRVHNGGGGKGSSTPIDSPDSLKSTSYIKILDLLCEGEIYGLATGDAKSIYLNNTPLENMDGTANFQDYEFDFRAGTEVQDIITGFNTVEAEEGIGSEVKYSTSVTSSYFSDNVVDRVRITLGIPSLVQYKSNGDVVGSTVQYKVYLLTNSGTASLEIINRVVEGKNTSRYQINHDIKIRELAPTASNYAIKIERVSKDSTSEKVQNSLFFDSITKISDTKLRYPHSAIVGSKIQSAQFSSVPTRGYHVKMLKVKVPSNYNPVTRTYSSFWDGTFLPSLQYTNNPAWCFYDLVTNKRYGLGEFIPEALVDKWTLYTIGKYCDELVSDGYGGMEPRFTLNIYLQTREDAIKVLTDLAGVFRGIVYVGDGTITAANDMPQGTPNLVFNNSNVIDGVFTYSGASKKVIHTAALVSWNDPESMYKQKVEYVEDIDSINTFGYNPTEVIAVGCTSRGQAHRVGKWLLYTERVESNIVSFSAGMDASYCRPGQIIKISDYALLNNVMSSSSPNSTAIVDGGFAGRVISVSGTVVTLDRAVPVGNSIVFTISSTTYPEQQVSLTKAVYTTSKFIISTQSGNTVTLTTAPDPAKILPGTVYAIQLDTLSESLYRVLYVKESNTKGIFEISAMMHNPSKYNFIENDIALVSKPYTTLTLAPSSIIDSSITYKANFYLNKDKQLANNIEVGFTPAKNAACYRVEYLKDKSSWSILYERLQYASFSLNNLSDDSYYSIKITPIGSSGLEATPSYINDIYVAGKTTPPEDVPWITIVGDILTIGAVSDIDLAGYRVKTASTTGTVTWENAVPESSELITSTTYKLNNYSKGILVLVKAVDTSGNESLNPTMSISSTYTKIPDNLVNTYSESPNWDGIKENLDISGTSLVAAPAISNPIMWPKVTIDSSQTIYGTAKGASEYVAILSTGPTNQIFNSSNGIIWSVVSGTGYGAPLNSIVYGNKYVVVGNGIIRYSTNSTTWSAQTTPASLSGLNFISVTYGNGVYVAVGSTGSTNIIYSSPDAITWTVRISTGNGGLASVCYGGGYFVACGNYTGVQSNLLYSVDGTMWTTVNNVGLGFNNNFYSIDYVTNSSRWVAVGNGGIISSTTNLTTWEIYSSVTNNPLNSIKCISDRDIIIACGVDNTVITSRDGVTWHLASTDNLTTVDTAKDYISIGYSTAESLFTVYSEGSSNNLISSDAQNFYHEPENLNVFPISSVENFYEIPNYKATRYTTREYNFSEYIGTLKPSVIFIDYSIVGDNLKLEYGIVGNKPMWGTSSANMWNTSSQYTSSMWDQSIPNFIPYTTKGIDMSTFTGYFKFRVSSNSSLTQLSIDKLDILVDMPDIVETINSYTVDGTSRISQIIGKFKQITNIQATLHNYSEPLYISIIDKNSALGPLLICRNLTGNTVVATADIIIKGY
jgi:predicted phage tail protein